MTRPDQGALDPAAAAYVVQRYGPPLPRHPRVGRLSDLYGRFYAPFAIWSVTLAFFPLFDDVARDGGLVTRYGTVFDMAARSGGEPAVIGIVLLGILVALLTVAAFRVRSPLLPALIAVAAALIVVMLAAKPGTGTPTPDLSASGMAGLVLAVAMMVLATTHAVLVTRLGGRPDPAGPTVHGG